MAWEPCEVSEGRTTLQRQFELAQQALSDLPTGAEGVFFVWSGITIRVNRRSKVEALETLTVAIIYSPQLAAERMVTIGPTPTDGIRWE